MREPVIPADEKKRLAALRSLALLDTPPEERFQRIVRLAAALFRVPIVLVSLVDAERQWFKASCGLEATETPRSSSFCGHAILGDDPLVVEDALVDPRFADNPLVTGAPHIRFYAGQPISSLDGHHVGTLCLIDRAPRTLDAEARGHLRDLARLVENELQQASLNEAVEALRESESHAAAVLQTALDCIISIDQCGNVIEFNPAAERTFGYRRDDAIGRELASLIIPPALRDAHRRGMAHFMESGEGPVLGKRIEVRAMHAGGGEFPVELAITPTYRGGEPAFTAYLRNITERKVAERDLSLQHRTASTLAEAIEPAEALPRILQTVCEALGWSYGAIWWVNAPAQRLECADVWHLPEARLADFAATSRKMHFERGAGMPGRVWEGGLAAWVPDVCEDTGFLRKSVAAQSGFHAALWMPIRSRGEILGVMEFLSMGVRDADRDMMLLLETMGNQIGQFIERRSGERRLLQLTTELDAIFNLSPDGFLAFDRDGIKSYVNRSLLAMLGLDASATNGMTEGDFDTILTERCARRETYRAIADAPDGEPMVIQINRPRPTTLIRTVKALRIADEEVLGKVVYLRDITREAEVDRMKTEFLSAAAHELRTPMASIHGFAELLLNRDYDAATRRDLLNTIFRQSSQLVHLVNELLDLARIESRQGKDFQIGSASIAQLVEEAVQAFSPLGSTREIRVTLPRRTVTVAADPKKFHQALVNVLSNAAKYSAADAPIEVTCPVRRKGVRKEAGVRIRDRGIGMTPEQVRRIFERFYRADESGSVPGAGLGMSLVKEIMDIHRGDIDIQSTPGEGTAVTLWLPRTEATRRGGEAA